MIVYTVEKENNMGPYRVCCDAWTSRSHANESHSDMFADRFYLYRDMVDLRDITISASTL